MAESESDSDTDSSVCSLEFSTSIRPYSYEPLAKKTKILSSESELSDNDSVTDEHESSELPRNQTKKTAIAPNPDDPDDQGDLPWCKCGNCREMPAMRENKCCHNYPRVTARFTDIPPTTMSCMTDHPGFSSNCLDEWVLEASVKEYVLEDGPLGDDELVHELLQYVSYRRFVRWIWGKLGRHHRKILPACIVTKIRERFHSEIYVGYRDSVY